MECPESEEELVGRVRDVYERGGKVQVRGRGTLVGGEDEGVLSMERYRGVIEYEPGERLLEVRAGTGLEEVREVLKERGQRLAFDPPDYGELFLREEGATIGGVVGAGLCGGGRMVWGGVRDHVLGMRVCDGKGRMYKAGGRTVKNVSGFDIGKMLVGSYGCMGVMSELVLNVVPRAGGEATVIERDCDVERAGEVARYVMRKPWNVVAASLSGGRDLLLRVEGERWDASFAKIKDYMGSSVEVVEGEESEGLWSSLRDGSELKKGMDVWQVLTSGTRGCEFLSSFLRVFGEGRGYFEWSGGRVWVMVREEEREKWEGFWKEEQTGDRRVGDRMTRRCFWGKGGGEEERTWEARFLARVKEVHDPRGIFRDYRRA